MNDYDAGYKLLFSHPKLVEDLLRQFVPEPWIADVDFSTLIQVNSSYVSENLRQRHDDLVWKVQLRDQWLYVYVLIEFQSKPDPYMALRLLVYVGLLYQDLLHGNQLPADGRLPPVLPIVLYHGQAPWNHPLEIHDLLTPIPAGLERYQPHFQFLLLDEQHYPETALIGSTNIAAALFRLDRSRTREELEAVISDLLKWLELPAQRSLRRAFGKWLRQVFLHRRLKGIIIPEIDDLLEVKTMLAQRWESWTEEWEQQGLEKGLQQGLQQGLEKGLEKGLQKGEQRGESKVLLKLLRKRFGELSASTVERITTASTTELDTWAERIFTATSVEEVLNNN